MTKCDLFQLCKTGSAFNIELMQLIYHINRLKKSYSCINKCKKSI